MNVQSLTYQGIQINETRIFTLSTNEQSSHGREGAPGLRVEGSSGSLRVFKRNSITKLNKNNSIKK